MSSFWDDIFPASLVTTMLFFLGFSVLLSTLGWISWLVSYEAITDLGIWFLISCILGGIFLASNLRETDFSAGLKHSALVSLINIGLFYFVLSFVGALGGVSLSSLRFMNDLGRGFIWLIVSAIIGTQVGIVVGGLISKSLAKRAQRKEEFEPMMLLKNRLSKGEISVEEYRKLKKEIEES